MRELDARLWDKHHEAFSNHLDAALSKGSAALRGPDRRLPMALKLAGLVLAIGAVTLSAPPPAAAQPAPTESGRTVAVPYGDLDLRAAAGRGTLEVRVERAAQRLCGPLQVVPLTARSERKACFDDVVANARRQVEEAYTGRAAGQVILATR